MRPLLSVLALLSIGAPMAGCGAGNAPPRVAARSPLVAPRVTPGELDGAVLLGDTPVRATRMGAGPMSIVASGEVVEGERVGAFVDLPLDVCLLAYARGSSSIEDLDVAAFDDEGNPAAIDEAPDPRPTLLLCPPHPARVYVAAHVANGEGLVAVAVQLVPRERAGELGRTLGARGGFGDGGRAADAWPGLDDHVRVHRQALGGAWEEIRKVAVTLDARIPTVVGFPIEADQCVDAVIVPDDEVALLEVEAVDGEGRVVARAREGATDRTLTVCSPLTFGGSLVIRPHVGRGLAAVVLGRARGATARDLGGRPDVMWATPGLPLDAARSERATALGKAGYAAPTVTTTGALTVGRRTSIPIDLGAQPAGCARVDVVAGAPLALVDAELWDEKGALVTGGEGGSGVTVFGCSRAKARLDLQTRGRPGPFAMTVRTERWKDASFAGHPLAAARMLARAAEGPAMVLAGAPTSARAVALDPGKMHAFDDLIPPGQCMQVTVGAEGEGTGLELRLLDVATSTELDRAHAEHAVAVRACAPAAASRPVHVELRSTSGKLWTVIGVRAG
jgi:hypothetical protein